MRSVVREAQGSMRVIDADNIDEMADDILAEEEADDLLEGERWGGCAHSRALPCLIASLADGAPAKMRQGELVCFVPLKRA